VNISAEARELQRIAELARRGDQARAEKVGQIKQQIESGKYQVDAGEVSRDILRSEVTRLLEKK
jgi:flagellar biosynthesis anti-sigma factor FlgM